MPSDGSDAPRRPPSSPLECALSLNLEPVIRAAAAGKIHFDLKNNTLYWDARSLEIFGLTPEQFHGKYEAWLERIHEHDLQRIQAEVAIAFADRSVIDLRYRIRRPTGEVRHIWAIGAIERDEHGEAARVAGLHLDETNVRRNDIESSIYSEVLSHMAEGVVISDVRSARVLYANPSMERMLGAPPGSLAGRALADLADATAEPLLERMRSEMEKVGNWLGEVPRRGRAGELLWTSTSVSELNNADHGRLWISIVLPLPRPHARDGSLASPSSNDDLESIYNSIADAVFAVDMPSRKIRYANRAVSQIFGYAHSEVLGASTRMLYKDASDYDKFGARLHQAFLAGERQVRAEQRLVTADGRELWVSIVTTFFIEDGQLTTVISAIRDMTREKDLETQLLHRHKMDAIGRLAGGVAHDMNNVLAAIMALSEVLKTDLREGTPHYEDVSQIFEAAQQGKSLVEGLLGFARKGNYTSRKLRMDSEVEKAVALLQRTMPKSVELSVALGAADAFVQGDSAQLSQTVINLCINALDAVEGSGRIEVKTAVETIGGEFRHKLPPGEYYRLSVTDNGVGMSEEILSHIFEPFFTTKEVGHGSGLGLSMTYGVLHNHGGAIEIESSPGEGTAVTCWLPVTDSPAESAGESTNPAERSRHAVRVLVIDDERLVRHGVTRLLARLGCESTAAATATEAVDLFRREHSNIDLVLLDMSMPHVSGEQCFSMLRQVDPRARIVVCTGHSDPAVSNALLHEGALDVLTKPFSIEQLRNVLERAAHG